MWWVSRKQDGKTLQKINDQLLYASHCIAGDVPPTPLDCPAERKAIALKWLQPRYGGLTARERRSMARKRVALTAGRRERSKWPSHTTREGELHSSKATHTEREIWQLVNEEVCNAAITAKKSAPHTFGKRRRARHTQQRRKVKPANCPLCWCPHNGVKCGSKKGRGKREGRREIEWIIFRRGMS